MEADFRSNNIEIDNLKKNINKYYAYSFLKDFMFFSAILIPFFTEWGRINFSQIMILQAIFTMAVFTFEIPTGAVADYLSRKTSIILGGLISAFGFLLYALYPSFWLFALGEVIVALGAALLSGADQSLLYDSLKQIGEESKSKRIFTRSKNFGMAGGMTAAVIGGLLAKLVGFQMTFLLVPVPIILAVLVATRFKEPKIKRKGEEKEGYWKILKEGIKYFSKHKSIKMITWDYIPVATLSFFLVWVYQVLLRDIGFNIAWFGLVHAAIFASEILLLHNLEKVEKFIGGKKAYLKYSAIITGVGFIALAFVISKVLVITIILVLAALGLTRKPIYYSYLNKHIESRYRTTVISVVSMIYSLTIAVTNLIFGFVVDYNFRLAMILIGSLILAFVLLSKMGEEHLLD